MADAGAVEQRPIGVANRTLVAQHQRQKHAAVSLISKFWLQPLAQVGAGTLDRIARSPNHRMQARNRRARAHIAGRTQVSFEHPGFEIKTAGIHGAVRPL